MKEPQVERFINPQDRSFMSTAKHLDVLYLSLVIEGEEWSFSFVRKHCLDKRIGLYFIHDCHNFICPNATSRLIKVFFSPLRCFFSLLIFLEVANRLDSSWSLLTSKVRIQSSIVVKLLWRCFAEILFQVGLNMRECSFIWTSVSFSISMWDSLRPFSRIFRNSLRPFSRIFHNGDLRWVSEIEPRSSFPEVRDEFQLPIFSCNLANFWFFWLRSLGGIHRSAILFVTVADHAIFYSNRPKPSIHHPVCQSPCWLWRQPSPTIIWKWLFAGIAALIHYTEDVLFHSQRNAIDNVPVASLTRKNVVLLCSRKISMFCTRRFIGEW